MGNVIQMTLNSLLFQKNYKNCLALGWMRIPLPDPVCKTQTNFSLGVKPPLAKFWLRTSVKLLFVIIQNRVYFVCRKKYFVILVDYIHYLERIHKFHIHLHWCSNFRNNQAVVLCRSTKGNIALPILINATSNYCEALGTIFSRRLFIKPN